MLSRFIAITLMSFIGFSLTPHAQASDQDEIRECLHHWSEHPFKKDATEFRTITSKVKVMGVGGEIADTNASSRPELVLIKPSVNVMSKNVMSLLNPNGWYCLSGKVDVLGKTEINLACKAHLASSSDGTTVLGSDSGDTGVTVLGKTEINKVGCGKKE